MGISLAFLILIALLVFIVTVVNKPGRNTGAWEEEDKYNRADRIDYLLSQIRLWQEEGTVDRDTAEMLAERYEAEKRQVLGYAPTWQYVPTRQSEIIDDELDFDAGAEPAGPGEDEEREELFGGTVRRLKEKMFKPAAPKPEFNLMNFLREKNIKWFNALGTLMLVASGIIFVATNWDAWHGGVKSLIMVLVTALFFAGGYFIRNKLELTVSGFAFYLVGALFVPLNFVAFNNFAVFGRQYDWHSFLALTAVVAMAFYSIMAFRLESQIFTGLAAFAGAAGLFELLSYYGLSYSRAGIYFVPLSLAYFLVYYLITRRAEAYRKTALPLPVAANVTAAVGLGLAAVDKLSFALFTTAVIASVTYLISTYLFKRLEYLYVCVGLMVLSVFPGVGYYHLPGRSYNLSFLFIAGLALLMSFINRRAGNKQFEQNFFYAMIGTTVLAGFFALSTQVQLFSAPLKYNPELAGGMLTMFGGAVIYLLSAYLYNQKAFTYVGITAFAAGYTMGLMWLGISGKLYGVFFLALSAVLLAVSKAFKEKLLWSGPAYLAGIIGNGLVTVLLAVLMVMYPQIFARHDANLLAGIIAFALNAAVYFYLAHDSRNMAYSAAGSAVSAFAYTITAVYLGLSKWQFGLYFAGLALIFLAAERLLAGREYYRAVFRYAGIIANFVPVLYYLAWFYFEATSFGRFNWDLLAVILAFLVVSGAFLYIVGRFRLPGFTYAAVAVDYGNFILFYDWLGLERPYTGPLLMVAVAVYLGLSRALKGHELFARPMAYSAFGANVLTTALMLALGEFSGGWEYNALILGLLANAAVYFYFAFTWQNGGITWAGLLPLTLAYACSLDRFRIDPQWEYLGLEVVVLALVLVGAGVLLRKRGYDFYYDPLFRAGYGLSALAVAVGFINPDTLIYPAFLALALYTATTYFTPVYREWFWRATLAAANIAFGAVIYRIEPDYTVVTYVKYFVVFNLVKFGLGFYFQYFEKKMDFAWSCYGGVIITSLASLALTFLAGDGQAAALVWLVYGVMYFAFPRLLEQSAATYVSAAVVTGGIYFVLRHLEVEPDLIGLYVAVLSFLWIWLQVLLGKFEVYRLPLEIIVPVSIGVPFISNLNAGYDAAITGSLLSAGAAFAQGRLQHARGYYFAAPLLLIAGYEAFLLKYEVNFQELYIAPFSIYLIAVSFVLRSYNNLFNYLSYLGLLALLGASYFNSFAGEDYLVHALVLGIVSAGCIILGAAIKHRGFFFLGIIFLLGDVSTQSRSFLMSLQKWFWIGLGGSIFLALGLLFDKKRKDRTMQVVNEQLERFKSWS